MAIYLDRISSLIHAERLNGVEAQRLWNTAVHERKEFEFWLDMIAKAGNKLTQGLLIQIGVNIKREDAELDAKTIVNMTKRIRR